MYDPSDARGTHGAGVGFAPTPADSRGAGGPGSDAASADSPPKDRGGISPAVAGYAAPSQESDRNVARNEDGDITAGAQQGSPALVYPLETRTGMEPIELSPIDGGMADPVRRGDTPARRPFSRFLFQTSKWWRDIEGDFKPKERAFAGQGNNGPKASMPQGRMDPMDEYRLLHDGSHA